MRSVSATGGEASQKNHEHRPEESVENAKYEERQRDTLRWGDRVRGAHDVIDHPRLPTDLRYHPASFEGDETQRRGDDERPKEPP